MRISRKRWVIMRNSRTEIWGGSARNYYFKPINDIGNFSIKTYLSRDKALSSYSGGDYQIEPVPIIETIEVAENV